MKNISNTIKSFFQRFSTQVAKRPFGSFLVALALFVGLIAVSNALQKPKVLDKKEEKPVTEVNTYYIGTSPKVQSQAVIKKSGVITIYAQSAGVVQQIYKKEGDTVAKGTNLLWISTNYTGSTISTAQRQLAQASYESTKNNLATNKDAIAKQRQIAQLNRENAEELRKINEDSVDETRGVIETNDAVLKNIVTNLEGMQATGSGTPAQIDALKVQQAQLQSGINQLRTANRNAQYQTNTNNPPSQLADLQKDLTLKQLSLQEKALDLQLEVSNLNLRLAQISESLSYPSSPLAGKIERINVQVGDLVNPGQALATIVTNNNAATAEVFISQSIALKASQSEASTLHLGSTTVDVMPSYISTQPTTGSLYTIKYTIPTENTAILANNSYITVDIPVGAANTGSTIPFIPIDAVYQTQDGAYVYTAQKDNEKTAAATKKIKLGQVIGSYVEVESGLSANDVIILDRNIVEGDLVMTKEQGLANAK